MSELEAASDDPRSRSEPFLAWRGVLLIAGTYIYFLIFAQFGFLNRLAELRIGQVTLTPIMAAMAAGGILSSLFGQHLLHSWTPATRLRAGLVGCAVAAGLSALPLTAVPAGCVSALIGLALGIVTVTLVASLRLWTGTRNALWTVAAGTGLGYFACNIPALFTASPRTTGLVSGLACLCAAALTKPKAKPKVSLEEQLSSPSDPVSSREFMGAVLAFTALVWLDSAAFFIIQNSPALKAGTWAGNLHLWRNGGVHLVMAFVSVWLLRRRGLTFTLLAAFACIAVAALLLHNPAHAAGASLFYPAGVSIYSVALVAYPSLLLADRCQADRERQAGILYAVAGWIGSALGIGMGQHLHRIPTHFIAAAGVAIAAPWLWGTVRTNRAPGIAFAAVFLSAYGIDNMLDKAAKNVTSSRADPIAVGRQVYISEGCIHCHSQYIRPHDQRDLTLWGPARDVEEIRRETPPLIGNRRQGPDLSEVGSRRSPLWLRIHFIDPRALSYRSIMPSYKELFSDDRGNALVAYVSSLKSPDATAHLHTMLTSWSPDSTLPQARENDGAMLFQQHCATCHVAGGQVRTEWAGSFRHMPPNLFDEALPLLPRELPAPQQTLDLERIMKFGVPGTDMPGHEYLPDTQIAALSHWLVLQRASRASVSTSAQSDASSTGLSIPPSQ